MSPLIFNELLKMVHKKRFWTVTLILIVLIPIFTYAHFRSINSAVKQLGTNDWRAILQQQIIDQQNRLTSSRVPEDWKKLIKLNIELQQYYLDHNINPQAPGAPTFTREFIEQAISLFIPLLVVILSADLVSSEHSNGTMKLLLTRPVPRWKVLLSKYISLVLAISFLLLITGILSYLISGIIFGYSGWFIPVLTGFVEQNGQLLTQNVHMVPQWQFILMQYGLAWFSCLTVGTISFMVSTLMRNTASSMGVMLAAIIAGTLLTQLAKSWPQLKYIAFLHLDLTNYLSGEPSMLEGVTLPFSLAILTIWSTVALVIAFVHFQKRDILG